MSLSDESSPCETTGRSGGGGGGGNHEQLAFDSAGSGDRRPLVEAGGRPAPAEKPAVAVVAAVAARSDSPSAE